MASAALPPSMTQTVRKVCLAARAHPRRSTFPERASLAATADRDKRVLMTRHEEGAFPPPATVSSLNSEDSTEQLICKTPLEEKEVKKVKESVCSKSVEAGSVESSRRRVVLVLGLAQVLAGALLAGAGGAGAARGAALARTGAGLWAGALAVVVGVVGALAGLRDCQPNQPHQDGRNGFLTAFLALSLVCLATGHGAAVLAATGLQRDATRPQAPMDSFQEEMDAWTPVLTNITVLIIACVHCLLCIISIYHVSRRVCSCLRPKPPYDHNQFDPTFRPPLTKLVQLDEKPAKQEEKKTGDIKALEAKLSGEKKKREDWCEWSASSAERAAARAVAARGPARPRGVAKRHPPAHPPMLLIHPASTLGRVPMSVMMPPRYATLPLPPYAPPPAPMFYPVHNPRIRRRGRRSPREPRAERRRRDGRERDSQLTRSLERIHRKRRAERDRLTDAELKRTYTGLDRAYAEQFIAVCDESRHASERLDSLASSATSESPAPRNSRQDGSRSTSAETHSFGGNSA